jgi:hypothetical protein
MNEMLKRVKIKILDTFLFLPPIGMFLNSIVVRSPPNNIRRIYTGHRYLSSTKTGKYPPEYISTVIRVNNAILLLLLLVYCLKGGIKISKVLKIINREMQEKN